jgi:hypothetical protein
MQFCERFCLAPALVLVIMASAPLPLRSQSDGIPNQINGTLTFYGCTPSPSDFGLFAVPQILEFEEGGRLGITNDRGVPQPELPVLNGVLERTGDPHVLNIRVDGAVGDVPYQLRIASSLSDPDYPPNPCKRVFWEGPEQGIVYPGSPVRLRGYAPNAEIEVLSRASGGRDPRGWVGAETIDVQNLADSTRQFRWRTDLPGVTGALIQVATEEFSKTPDSRTSCASAPGILFSSTVPARTGVWNSLPPLNLALIAAQVAFSGPSGLQQYELFNYGAPLYVRVIPIAGSQRLCDSKEHGPAPWVVLANVRKTTTSSTLNGVLSPTPSSNLPVLLSSAHYFPAWFWEHPKSGATAYRVVRDHTIPSNPLDALYHDPFAYKIAKHTSLNLGDTVPKGFLFWYKPGSSGFSLGSIFEGAVQIVTGVVDAVGMLVNQVSKIYDNIKKAVVKIAAGALSSTGLYDCSNSPNCKALLETALNTGLSAMGLPPDLPNWDAIVSGGKEYLAAELVSQAGIGNVPGSQALANVAIDVVEKSVQDLDDNRGGGGDLPQWLTLYFGQEPAVLVVNLATSNPGGSLFPNYLDVTGHAALLGTGVHLPTKWTPAGGNQRRLHIPVVLRPELKGFVPPKGAFGGKLPDYTVGLVAKQWWKDKLATIPCVKSDNKLMIKTGPLAIPSVFTIPSVSYNPTVQTNAPPYMACTP